MKLVIFAALIFSHFANGQTCIIAKKTKDAIYLGADSRFLLTYTYRDGSNKVDTGSMCKIFKKGKYNFALSGFGLVESKMAIENVIKNVGSFDSLLERYTCSYREILLQKMVKLATGMPYDSFMTFVKRNSPYLCNAVFFGEQSDTLFLGMAYFTVRADRLYNINIDSNWGEYSVLFAGHYNNIAEKCLKEGTWVGDIPKVISDLIKIEVNKNQYEVGGQIHLIKFTIKRGVEWVGGRKYPCN